MALSIIELYLGNLKIVNLNFCVVIYLSTNMVALKYLKMNEKYLLIPITFWSSEMLLICEAESILQSPKNHQMEKKSPNKMETKLIFASVYLVPSFGFSWRKNLFVFELAIAHTHTQTQKLTLTSLSFARCEVGCSTRAYPIRTFYFDKRKMFTRYLLLSNLFWGTKLCLTIWSNRNYHL